MKDYLCAAYLKNITNPEMPHNQLSIITHLCPEIVSRTNTAPAANPVYSVTTDPSNTSTAAGGVHYKGEWVMDTNTYKVEFYFDATEDDAQALRRNLAQSISDEYDIPKVYGVTINEDKWRKGVPYD